MTNAPRANPMNTSPSQPDTTTPADLLDLEQALRASALASRAGASADRLDRMARASWLAAEPAPAPLAFTPAAQPFFTPLRMAAMLALGASLLTSVAALRTSPSSSSRTLARAPVASPAPQPQQSRTFATADATDLTLFDTYLALADENRSELDAFTQDASDLQDSFDSLSTGDDWLSPDTDVGTTQGAS